MFSDEKKCRCNTGIEIPKVKAKLFWIIDIQELFSKIQSFFKEFNLNLIQKFGILEIELKNPKEFFEQNLDFIKNYFNELERSTIKIYFSEDGIINISDLANAKFLQNYINVIEDKDFFDVINNQSFTSYFQPIIDMQTKKIFGYESLIRDVKRDTQLMYPNEIFEKSRRNDLNFLLDRVCRETALKTSATKRIKKKVFINFLPTSIYDPKFCLKSTAKWANQLEFDPKNIIFEVVETEKVSDRKHLVKILEYYREQGYLIALDDVGEGYSSLNMLIELKPNFIKVDREIITNIDKNSLKQSVYKALYNTAKENNISVLAEGIETLEEIQFLREIGVDYGQGYFFGKPQAEPLRQIRDF